MDMALINTKALMIPTPGQIEQEYLSEYHNEKGTFYSVNQDNINLINDVEKAKQTTGIIKKCNVEKTVENIMETFHSNEKSPFN
jgi:hypothetical protein